VFPPAAEREEDRLRVLGPGGTRDDPRVHTTKSFLDKMLCSRPRQFGQGGTVSVNCANASGDLSFSQSALDISRLCRQLLHSTTISCTTSFKFTRDSATMFW
jgi:hypothetical protein